jgi:hypothetical protein
VDATAGIELGHQSRPDPFWQALSWAARTRSRCLQRGRLLGRSGGACRHPPELSQAEDCDSAQPQAQQSAAPLWLIRVVRAGHRNRRVRSGVPYPVATVTRWYSATVSAAHAAALPGRHQLGTTRMHHVLIATVGVHHVDRPIIVAEVPHERDLPTVG